MRWSLAYRSRLDGVEPGTRSGLLRRRPWTWSLLGLVLVCATAAAAQPVPVSLEVTPEEITVGDRVEARLTLVWDGEAPTSEPRFPAWGETWGGADVLAAGEVESSEVAGRRVYVQTLTLTAFATGTVRLPQVTVAVPLAGETVDVPTRDVSFLVLSVLPEEAAGDEDVELLPRGVAPFLRRPGPASFYWTTLALVLLILLATRRLAARLRRLPADLGGGAAVRILEPLEELVKNLDAIDPASGSEPAHTAMSQALRRFLGRRLEMNALESTTSEIQRRLRDAALSSDEVQGSVTFLRQCDQVKFARQEVAPEVTGERIASLRTLALRIEDQLRPEPEPREEAA